MGKKINKKILLLYGVIVLFIAYIVVLYGVIGAEHTPMVKGKMKQVGFHYPTWKMLFYPHIILGVISLALGPFQFTNKSHRNKAVHKLLGKIYAATILVNVLAVPYIALFSTGGVSSEIAFLILDAFWLVTTLMGIVRIYQRNIQAHKLWMLRSYAVTWVFVSFRLFVAVFSIFMDASLAFPIAVYVAIAVNLLFVEAFQKKRNNKSQKRASITGNSFIH